MSSANLKNRLSARLLKLAILLAISSLAGILHHTTEIHEDHDFCELCFLASNLFIVIAITILILEFCGSINSNNIVNFLRNLINPHLIRGPPALLNSFF
jgi:hypothetical protein